MFHILHFNPLDRAIFKNAYLLLNKSGRLNRQKILRFNPKRRSSDISLI